MIAGVLFDLDETLLDRSGSLVAFLRDQHERFGEQLGAVAFAPWRDRFLALDARGMVAKSEVYPALLASFGGDPAAAAVLNADYQSHCPDHARPFEGMTPMLEGLRARGLPMGLVTNGQTAFQTRHIMALGLHHHARAVLISEAEGLRKPDPDLFDRAAQRLGLVPRQCLFVGDNPVADILGAHAIGMRTAWFRNGMAWPEHQPPAPDAVIDHLMQVLDLVDGALRPARESP